MANQTKPHRYLVVLDIESPESISDAELLAELNGEQWMGSPPWRVVVAATVLSRTADAADVATNVAEDPRTWPHSFVGYHGGRKCGVIIDDDSDPAFGPAARCMRRREDPIHQVRGN